MKIEWTGMTALRWSRSYSVRWALAVWLLVVLPFGIATAQGSGTPPPDPTVTAVTEMVSAGQFHAAKARISAALKKSDLSAVTQRALRFQRVRMRRMRLDFSLTADQVKAQIRKKIPELTDAQFAYWDAHDLLEHMVIDGKVRYFMRAPSNLFVLSQQARAMAHLPPDLNHYAGYAAKVIHAALKSGHTSVLPQRIQVTHSIVVKPNAIPAGKTLRVWIPYPQAIPGQQEDIKFVRSVPAQHFIAPKSTLQRTVYLHKVEQVDKPTVFSVTYQVTLYAQYHPIQADKVVPVKITPALAQYVAQRPPHVVFTHQLRVFSHQIVGDTTNPYLIARKLFAAVQDLPWAGARAYSTIPDLSMYTLDAGHGDCGEQTMLMIVLLRMNGIPARWQSGWTFTKGTSSDIHDWAEMYLAPYGWVPFDVTHGLLRSKDPAVKWFYLGGLDNFRIAFNNAYGTKFVPVKHYFRTDPVDNQVGEVEWAGGNVFSDYYNESNWTYHFKWHFLPVGKQATVK